MLLVTSCLVATFGILVDRSYRKRQLLLVFVWFAFAALISVHLGFGRTSDSASFVLAGKFLFLLSILVNISYILRNRSPSILGFIEKNVIIYVLALIFYIFFTFLSYLSLGQLDGNKNAFRFPGTVSGADSHLIGVLLAFVCLYCLTSGKVRINFLILTIAAILVLGSRGAVALTAIILLVYGAFDGARFKRVFGISASLLTGAGLLSIFYDLRSFNIPEVSGQSFSNRFESYHYATAVAFDNFPLGGQWIFGAERYSFDSALALLLSQFGFGFCVFLIWALFKIVLLVVQGYRADVLWLLVFFLAASYTDFMFIPRVFLPILLLVTCYWMKMRVNSPSSGHFTS